MMVDMTDVPCGERLQFAIEHGPAEIVNFPMNSMVIFIVMFVYQSVKKNVSYPRCSMVLEHVAPPFTPKMAQFFWVNIPTPWSIWVLTNK